MPLRPSIWHAALVDRGRTMSEMMMMLTGCPIAYLEVADGAGKLLFVMPLNSAFPVELPIPLADPRKQRAGAVRLTVGK